MALAVGSHVEIGQLMVAISEPHREGLAEYHRWFESDHMYSSVLVGPGAFSANRYVATRELKALRAPRDGGVFEHVEAGSFTALYFIAEGSVEEHFAWSFPAQAELGRQGRNNPHRELVLTWLCDYRGRVGRDADSVPPEVALDHPYPGLVMAWVDRGEAASLEDLQAGLEDSLLPGLLAGSPIDQVLFFSPRDFPAPRPEVPLTPGAVEPNACVGERLLVLFFLDCPPQQAWAARFESLGAVLTERGLGDLALAAPFLPALRGTSRYLDALW